MADYDITQETDLVRRCYAETGYEDTRDELPRSDLDLLVDSAKHLLALKADIDDGWYSDRGLGLALLGVTCIKAKARVENYSVESWSVDGGAVDITARDPDGDAVQFTHYEEMIQTGLSSAENVSSASDIPTNINSANYVD